MTDVPTPIDALPIDEIPRARSADQVQLDRAVQRLQADTAKAELLAALVAHGATAAEAEEALASGEDSQRNQAHAMRRIAAALERIAVAMEAKDAGVVR